MEISLLFIWDFTAITRRFPCSLYMAALKK